MKLIISFLYAIGMPFYSFILSIVAMFGHKKAKLLVNGRKETWKKLAKYDNSSSCVWVHAASLGEFEQGRPIIEAIRAKYPKKKIVLSFYSPSGYEVRKNYKEADLVCYLPADSASNAKRFINAINPEIAFFVKYEFWHHYINEISRRGIALYGVSVILREAQPFFQSWGEWFRDMLHKYTRLYVQDAESANLLKSIGIAEDKYVVAGDTRFDRVSQIAANAPDVDIVARFVKNASKVIVMGSAWPPDDEVLFPYINEAPKDIKLIVAPHEIHSERIKGLVSRLKVKYSLFTEPAADIEDCQVLVVNTIGLLSTIYKYGQIGYIGGGFGVGIHNTLEAATYSMPVLFGPNYKRFKEAVDLISCGGGFCISSKESVKEKLDLWLNNAEELSIAGKKAGEYVASMCGATEKIMKEVEAKFA
ncbi:MAG: glycosyltransferase N-terminal domain-containing protein [Bacteroidia bacterium]|nr:glycosyltransferase N-terminal domain-containing protein [Bacteroidia bacterium]